MQEIGELKMKVGMIGLGKLGLPCLLAMEKYGGHEVFGYDISDSVISPIRERKVQYWEEGVNELLLNTRLCIVNSVQEIVENCDIIFIAVPTPHDKDFEGLIPTPNNRKDFDYSMLAKVAEELGSALGDLSDVSPLIVTISTVLPGTMAEVFLPKLKFLGKRLRFCYNPYFIAMGTTINDFLNPEFILIGGNNLEAGESLQEFYQFLGSECIVMDIESAELTKVAYNTFIGFKIVFANTLAEITQFRGGNVDSVTFALSKATNRLMSGKYMLAGMGDGGGCHPRDQIAMSWLAREANISVDVFDFLARARDAQTLRQAELIIDFCQKLALQPVLLGISYKPNSPLTVGSPAILLKYFLEAKLYQPQVYDPWVYPNQDFIFEKSVYFVASRHDEFKDLSFISHSVIIDPWGHVEKVHETSELVLPGRK